MLELIATNPEFDVRQSEYTRLLGFPRDYEVAGRVRELVDWARRWYAEHGNPWWYARQTDGVELGDGAVTVEGTTFVSARLHDLMTRAGADSTFLVAVSAGSECEEHARELWDDGKPDEYLFLEVFGSAVVEALVAAAAYRLCQWADGHGLAVLPHYSPGYPEWDIADQERLLDRIGRGGGFAVADRLSVMETGMLRPKKSLLAVFGLTSHVERVQHLGSLVPCERCSLAGCAYRRAPYRHPLPQIEDLRPARSRQSGAESTPAAAYAVSPAALEKWSRQRLKLRVMPDRTVEARFRYEGTTCSNMGQPLAFDYRILLSSPEEGYTIIDARCVPAPGDTGHTYMCEYLMERELLMDAIGGERPLVGRPLEDVLRWRREHDPAGCYCDPGARAHKWGLVYEVLHFALAKSVASGLA